MAIREHECNCFPSREPGCWHGQPRPPGARAGGGEATGVVPHLSHAAVLGQREPAASPQRSGGDCSSGPVAMIASTQPKPSGTSGRRRGPRRSSRPSYRSMTSALAPIALLPLCSSISPNGRASPYRPGLVFPHSMSWTTRVSMPSRHRSAGLSSCHAPGGSAHQPGHRARPVSWEDHCWKDKARIIARTPRRSML